VVHLKSLVLKKRERERKVNMSSSPVEQGDINEVRTDILMDINIRLNEAPVAVLKKILKDCGLVVKGVKQDLMDRILHAVCSLFHRPKDTNLARRQFLYLRLNQFVFSIDSVFKCLHSISVLFF
jgi:hypothetical protein